MEVIKLADLPTKAVNAYASLGARVTHLFSSANDWSVVRIQLEPGGVLGMHPADNEQLFIVVKGGGFVRVQGSEPVPVSEGDCVLWRGGEEHETRAGEEGLVAIVVEGEA